MPATPEENPLRRIFFCGIRHNTLVLRPGGLQLRIGTMTRPEIPSIGHQFFLIEVLQ